MALLPSNGKLTCNKSDERRSMMNTLCVSALYLLDQRRKKVSNLQIKSELNKVVRSPHQVRRAQVSQRAHAGDGARIAQAERFQRAAGC